MEQSDGPAVSSLLLPAQRLARALEGQHRWGFVEVAPSSGNPWSQKRLTVFAPGTTGAERRALTRHRDWPIAGAAVTMFLMLALGEFLPPVAAVTIAVALYCTSVAVSAHLTRELRSRSHRLEVTYIENESGRSAKGDAALLERALAELEALESALDRGELSPVEFEAGWARVYEQVPAGAPEGA